MGLDRLAVGDAGAAPRQRAGLAAAARRGSFGLQLERDGLPTRVLALFLLGACRSRHRILGRMHLGMDDVCAGFAIRILLAPRQHDGRRGRSSGLKPPARSRPLSRWRWRHAGRQELQPEAQPSAFDSASVRDRLSAMIGVRAIESGELVCRLWRSLSADDGPLAAPFTATSATAVSGFASCRD